MPNFFHQKICNLLIFVLLFNTATPIAVSATQDLLGEQNKVLICTSEGFKWINADSVEQTDFQQNIEQQQHCPMCILHDDQGNAVISYKFDHTLLTNHVAFKYTKKSDRVSNTLFLHEQGSRAPPINS